MVFITQVCLKDLICVEMEMLELATSEPGVYICNSHNHFYTVVDQHYTVTTLSSP